MTNNRDFPVAAKGALPQWVMIAALTLGSLAGCAQHGGSTGQATAPDTRIRTEGGEQTHDTGFKAVPYREFQMAFEVNSAFPVIVEIPANYVLFKFEDAQMDRRVFWIPEDVESEARSTQMVPNRGRFLVKHTFDVLYDGRSKTFQGEEAMKEFANRFEKLHFDGFIVVFMELESDGSYIYTAYLAIAGDKHFTEKWLVGKYQGPGSGLWGTVLQVSYVPPNFKKTDESDEVWKRFTNSIVSSASPLLQQK